MNNSRILTCRGAKTVCFHLRLRGYFADMIDGFTFFGTFLKVFLHFSLIFIYVKLVILKRDPV